MKLVSIRDRRHWEVNLKTEDGHPMILLAPRWHPCAALNTSSATLPTCLTPASIISLLAGFFCKIFQSSEFFRNRFTGIHGSLTLLFSKTTLFLSFHIVQQIVDISIITNPLSSLPKVLTQVLITRSRSSGISVRLKAHFNMFHNNELQSRRKKGDLCFHHVHKMDTFYPLFTPCAASYPLWVYYF